MMVKPITHKCIWCGRAFTSPLKDDDFCSFKCYEAYNLDKELGEDE